MTENTSARSRTRHHTALAPAALACMGVVFGDIGTSPLYTLQIATKAASPSGAISPDGGSRSGVADFLVTDHRHFHQVCAPDHARRQPRRGWYSGASRPGESAPRQDQPAACGDGHHRSHRCHAALRRRHDHAGDFGAERHRGHQALRAPDGEIRGSADACDPRGAVRHPAQGHILGRRPVRTGHAGLVRRDRHSRHHRNRQGTRDSRRAQSPAGNPLFVARGTVGAGGDWRCFPGGHRR